MAKFTVDTHLFRELGELLVGRDSTALVELIKNSYDADATEVIVYGENLGKPNGKILISDNGNGMTKQAFVSGFLRIASRLKEHGERRSPIYRRRYTGAKGIGRLAAQKLALKLRLLSSPNPEVYTEALGRKPSHLESVEATIDWKKIDNFETLDDDGIESAITVETLPISSECGTEIRLTRLRGKWTPTERSRITHEVTTFQPPEMLIRSSPKLFAHKPLFDTPLIRDSINSRDPGLNIKLEGDFDVGEEYWNAVAESADWILEIQSIKKSNSISYQVTPTKAFLRDHPNADQQKFDWKNPPIENIPTFQSRILIRDGNEGIKSHQRAWLSRSGGIRIYMEGFRVLPYGDTGDDWLELDSDYTKRQRSLQFLDQANLDLSRFVEKDEDVGLLARRKGAYFGAVFLTNNGASDLEMLVNREGFLPNAAFLSLKQIVRVGIDLSVRVKAYETPVDRQRWRDQRVVDPSSVEQIKPERAKLREDAESAASKATELARQARVAANAGDLKKAETLILSAGKEIKRGSELTSELISDRSIMQILAGVGLQMASFVHEMNALLGMANAVEIAVAGIDRSLFIGGDEKKKLASLSQGVGDLKRVVERQASYLQDITSPDARRRRSRLVLRDRFDAAVKLVRRAADKRGISIDNSITADFKSPPMFPAELMVVFANLLTNAIKACDRRGKIQAKARTLNNGNIAFRLQNTGTAVDLDDAEKWFLPFRSTTVESDPVLGQGMGMGLPIVKNILEEYGASIRFVQPTSGFSTAIQIEFN